MISKENAITEAYIDLRQALTFYTDRKFDGVECEEIYKLFFDLERGKNISLNFLINKAFSDPNISKELQPLQLVYYTNGTILMVFYKMLYGKYFNCVLNHEEYVNFGYAIGFLKKNKNDSREFSTMIKYTNLTKVYKFDREFKLPILDLSFLLIITNSSTLQYKKFTFKIFKKAYVSYRNISSKNSFVVQKEELIKKHPMLKKDKIFDKYLYTGATTIYMIEKTFHFAFINALYDFFKDSEKEFTEKTCNEIINGLAKLIEIEDPILRLVSLERYINLFKLMNTKYNSIEYKDKIKELTSQKISLLERNKRNNLILELQYPLLKPQLETIDSYIDIASDLIKKLYSNDKTELVIEKLELFINRLY